VSSLLRSAGEVPSCPGVLELPRIALVSTHGYVAAEAPLGAADTGGQVVYVLELAKHLAKLGHQVDIWTRRFEGQPASEIVDEGVRILRAPCGGRDFIAKEYLYSKLGEWAENALRFIRKEGISYSFIDSHYWDGGVAAQFLCDALGVPHLHTPHSLGLWKKRQMLTDFPGDEAKFEAVYNFETRIRHERQLLRDCELVIATTPVQTDMLRADYDVPVAKMRMVPPGYDDTRFYPVGEGTRELLRKRLGFNGKVVLSLGRLARNKGYDLLISAFQEVIEREPEARLHLAIGGDRLDPREEQILADCRALVKSLGLEAVVTFAGFVPDAELPDLYRAADAFVLSSRYEPFGMTAVEAMACGTPTIVTTHGGLFRVLRFGIDGLFADTFDAADLGLTTLKPLRHRKLAERLSRNGAHTARSLFTWTGVAQQILAAFEDRAPQRVSVSELEQATDWFGPEEGEAS
jgi:mannosylfructose-phosphate synthase